MSRNGARHQRRSGRATVAGRAWRRLRMRPTVMTLEERSLLSTFTVTSTADDGSVEGHFVATGVRPRFLGELQARGIKIPGSYFDPSKPL